MPRQKQANYPIITINVPQDVVLPLGIYATFFNNLSVDVRYFLISEGFQVPPRPPTETNHHENQMLILVINVETETENNIRTIKAAVQLASRSLHPRTFMDMLGGKPLKQISGLVGSFQSE